MTSIANISDNGASQLRTIFQNLLAAVPPGAAALGSGRTKNNDGTIIWLNPSNPRAAEFSAHIEDGNPSLIDVSFGSVTTFELPWDAQPPKNATLETMLDTVKAMGLAVIAGKSREYFGFLAVRGTLEVDDVPLRMTSFFHLRLFPKLVQYEPYTA